MFTKIIKITVVLLCLSALTVPSSVRSAAGDIQPFASAPECPDANGDGHGDVTDNVDFGKFPDNRLYHDLWNEKDGCHYNHEHGDSPYLANKYFGAPGTLWGGQTIAYPFMSSNGENVLKHDGYKWVVRIPEYHPWPQCGTRENNDILIDHSDFCIVAARAQLHVTGNLMDVATRFHSGFVEVYGCKPPYSIPQDCGTFKMGSSLIDWGQPRSPFYQTFRPRPFPGYNQPTFTIDFGTRIGNGMVMEFKTDTSDLPSNSGEPYINVREYSEANMAFFRSVVPQSGGIPVEQWSSNDFDCEPRLPGEPCHNSYFSMFYSVNDAWNLLDTTDMRIPHFICEVGKPCHYNGSLTGLNATGIRVLPEWDMHDSVLDGRVTWNGFTDRFGNPRMDNICTAPGFDCVPFAMVNIPVGVADKADILDCLCSAWEHDIYFDSMPSGWIEFNIHAHDAPQSTPPAPTSTPSSSTPFVSADVNPASLAIGGTASVSVNLNNVPVEGYQSAEFTCTYNAGLVEKSNISVTSLFGADSAVVIHDSQPGSFIVAIAGANGNKATTSGTAFTFSLKGLQAGQAPIQCAARVSKGDNIPLPLPASNANLTVLGTEPSPTMPPHDSPTPTPGDGGHEHPTATEPPLGSPTPLPSTDGALTGQILAGKPVTVTLYNANNVIVQSLTANPDGTFMLLAPAGAYTLTITADGFLGYQGAVSLTAGNTIVKPAINLPAGDIDGNNVIDQFDALTIGMSYTSSAPSAADLNNDGVIDFLDLELLAENYRKTGPLVWE